MAKQEIDLGKIGFYVVLIGNLLSTLGLIGLLLRIELFTLVVYLPIVLIAWLVLLMYNSTKRDLWIYVGIVVGLFTSPISLIGYIILLINFFKTKDQN